MFLVLKKRLFDELKANRGKTVVLACLLVVGLYFWIPPLWRALGFGSDPPRSAAAPRTPHEPPTAEVLPQVATITWDRADDVLARDPLVKSAEVAAISGDPFRIDPDQFPPPASFVEESSPSPGTPGSDIAPGPADLVLKSTIVGRTRRAAFINSKLYHEGAEVRVGGETYRLESVEPRRVLLSRDGESFELSIALPTAIEIEP